MSALLPPADLSNSLREDGERRKDKTKKHKSDKEHKKSHKQDKHGKKDKKEKKSRSSAIEAALDNNDDDDDDDDDGDHQEVKRATHVDPDVSPPLLTSTRPSLVLKVKKNKEGNKEGKKKDKHSSSSSKTDRKKKEDYHRQEEVPQGRQKRTRDVEEEGEEKENTQQPTDEAFPLHEGQNEETDGDDDISDVMSDINVLPVSTHQTPAMGILNAKTNSSLFEFPDLPPTAGELRAAAAAAAAGGDEEEEEDDPVVKKEKSHKKDKSDKTHKKEKKHKSSKKGDDVHEPTATAKIDNAEILAKKKSRSGKESKEAAEEGAKAPSRFTVLVLGASGTGKTTLVSRGVPPGTTATIDRHGSIMRLDQWPWPVEVFSGDGYDARKNVQLTFQDISQFKSSLLSGKDLHGSAGHINDCLHKAFEKWRGKTEGRNIYPDAILLLADPQDRASFGFVQTWLQRLKVEKFRLGKVIPVTSVFLAETKCDADEEEDDDDNYDPEEDEEWDVNGRSQVSSPNDTKKDKTKSANVIVPSSTSQFFHSLAQEFSSVVKGVFRVSSFTNKGLKGMVTQILRVLFQDPSLTIVGRGSSNNEGGLYLPAPSLNAAQGNVSSLQMMGTGPGSNSHNMETLVNLPRQSIRPGDTTFQRRDPQADCMALYVVPEDLRGAIRINGDVFSLEGLARETVQLQSPEYNLKELDADMQRRLKLGAKNPRCGARIAVDELFGEFVFLECLETKRIMLPSPTATTGGQSGSGMGDHTTLVCEGLSYQTKRFNQHHAVVAGRMEKWEYPALGILPVKTPGVVLSNPRKKGNKGDSGYNVFVQERGLSASLEQTAKEWALLTEKEKEVYKRMSNAQTEE